MARTKEQINTAHREWRRRRMQEPAYREREQERHRRSYEQQKAANPERWREYNKKRYRSRKMRAVIERGGRCVDCGFDLIEHPECGDFDHRPDESKTVNPGKATADQQWLEEIAKCDLVCSNCHRIRTRQRAERKVVSVS